MHYAEASDPNYLEDLSFTPGLSTNPYLESSARLVYQAPASYTVQALIQKGIDEGARLIAGMKQAVAPGDQVLRLLGCRRGRPWNHGPR